MVFARKLPALLLPIACLGLSACIDGGSGPTTTQLGAEETFGQATLSTGVEEGGLEGGELEECVGYAEACAQDPYCACFAECAGSGLSANDCLAKCQLAQVPYWAQKLVDCFGDGFDTGGQETGQPPDESGGTTTGVTTGVTTGGAETTGGSDETTGGSDETTG